MVKFIIVTQEDPFYLPAFFQRFFDQYGKELGVENFPLAGILIQPALGNESKLALAKRLLGFYGIWDFLKYGLKYFSSKVRTLLYARGLISKATSIEYFAKKNNIPVLSNFSDVNDQEFIDFVIENEVDLIVSVAASQIFREGILSTPRFGCINIHNAPLPFYRGMLPNFWQMYHGEQYSVMSIHEMVPKLDAGRILKQKRTEISREMTLHELILSTKTTNADALIELLKEFQDGTVTFRELEDTKGSYFTFPKRNDVKEFRRRGYKLS